MPTNIEIKARVADRDGRIPQVEALAGTRRIDMEQDDTFFRCDGGRLKLRTTGDGEGQLIFYQRPDETGPNVSFYTATVTQDPQGLREALTLAYGSVGRVRKHRVLFISGRTRIHLDRVIGLGDFVELEVALEEAGDSTAATLEAQGIMEALGIEPAHLVSTAYVDLINTHY